MPDLRLPLLGVAAWAGGLAGHLLPAGITVAASPAVRRGPARRPHPGPRRPRGHALRSAAGLRRGGRERPAPPGAGRAQPGRRPGRRARGRDPRADGDLRPAGRRGQVRRAGAAPRPGHPGRRARAGARPRHPRAWSSPTTAGPGSSWGAGCGPSGGSRRRTVRESPPSCPSTEPPSCSAGPVSWWRGADAVRESLRDSVAHRPPEPAGAGPGPGRRRRLRARPATSPTTSATTGLTHLLAVSGTNLTLVVGFLLVLARWCGVRGRWTATSSVRWASSGSCSWPAPSRACCGRPRWGPSPCSRWAPTAGGAAPARSAPPWWRCSCSTRCLAVSVGLRAVGDRDRRHPAARARLA